MKIKTLRRWHKRLSIYFGLVILFYALSGIILNHRSWVAKITIDRQWLPSNFHLHNWNQASIRGKINLSPTQRLIFGNIGVYKTDYHYQNFQDFNQGLPKGIDFKRSFDLLKSSQGNLFLATESGIFIRRTQKWDVLDLPELQHRIYSLAEIDQQLFFMDRSNLYSFPLDKFRQSGKIILTKHQLHAPNGFKNNLSLFRTLWFIHSGEIFGFSGKLVVDFLSLLIILLVLTGFFFLLYKWIKKRKLFSLSATTIKIKLRSLHLSLGSSLAIFFIISAITGTFLRPPFLILINDIELPKIPGTHFYNQNPWFEKLRGFYYDHTKHHFFIFTGKGDIYHTNNLHQPLQKVIMPPPLSIMGINHFSKLDKNYYLVGSFSGLFAWDPIHNLIFNYFTRQKYIPPSALAPPVSDHLISGIIKEPNTIYTFDYSYGCENFNQGIMPRSIKQAYPMSLWNLALEIHTGRLFSQYLGPLFLLYVPFSGIALTIILFMGLLLWYKAYRKKRKTSSK